MAVANSAHCFLSFIRVTDPCGGCPTGNTHIYVSGKYLPVWGSMTHCNGVSRHFHHFQQRSAFLPACISSPVLSEWIFTPHSDKSGLPQTSPSPQPRIEV